MQTCISPIKTSIRKLRCIACVQTYIALNDVLLGISSSSSTSSSKRGPLSYKLYFYTST